MKKYIALFNDHGKPKKESIAATNINAAFDFALSKQTRRKTLISVCLQPE